MSTRIACRHMVTGERDEACELTLVIDEGRILAVEEGIAPEAVLLEGWVVPGFVDTHCHGAAGADFTDPDVDDVLRAVNHHRRHGSTTILASTVASSAETLLRQIEHLRLLVETSELAGIHVEGPFLEPCRAEDESPAGQGDVIDAILEASHGSVRMVTLTPERPHIKHAVERLRRAGVTVALGHTDADAELTRQAVDAGMTVATHLFNAMREIKHLVPGPVPVLLNDPRVTVELICDGVHVDPEVIRMAINVSNAQRVSLVTDAMSACGHADGSYLVGEMPTTVVDGVARVLNLDETPGAIAGSTLTMDRAFAAVVGLGFSFVEASRMASTTPARTHGLDQVGTLRRGAWADLCQLDDSGQLQAVMRRGEWLDRPTT